MKRKIIGLCIAMIALFITGCANPATNTPAETTTTPPTGNSVITLLAIPGVSAPVMGATPITTPIDTAQYSGTITWSPTASSFAANTVYTANIVLTAKTGWTLTGVAANSFTVTGATSVKHMINSGNVTAIFPATGATPAVTLDGTTLSKAYMAYYGAVTALMTVTPTVDPVTKEYVVQNADGSAKARYAMNLSNPMLTVGAYTFTNYADSASGYKVNGTLSYVMTTDPSSVSSFYYKGTLAYTGGTVTGLSLDYSMSGAALTGTMTIGSIVYDIATFMLKSTPAVATPIFSVASGAYSTAQNVNLSCATDGAEIFYTLDGSSPTSGSIKFASGIPITVNASQAIRAIAIKAGMTSSVVSMGGYVFAPVTPSTINFADGISVSRMIGSGTYTNGVSGIGEGAVTYSSDTPSTATVNASTGEVTLVAPGTTVITASKAATSTYTAVSNTYTLTVTALTPSTIVFADGATVSRMIGSGAYTNIVSGIGAGAISYASGTPSVAVVDVNTGAVTLVAPGSTVITASKVATTTHAAASNSYTLTVTRTPPVVYVAGVLTTYANDKNIPGYWKNGIWNALPSLDVSQKPLISSLLVSDGDIYIGGFNINSADVCRAGYWKNGNWIGLPYLDSKMNSGAVGGVVVSNGSVYAGGYTMEDTGSWFITHPCYWKDGVLHCLPRNDSDVSDMVVSGGSLYFSGAWAPGYWKDEVWHGLTVPSGTNFFSSTNIVISGNDIYVAANIHNSSNDAVGYWKNDVFITLPSLDVTKNAWLADFKVYDGVVYASGSCYNSSGSLVSGYWANGVWQSLVAPGASGYDGVNSIVVSGGNVYATGIFTNTAGEIVAGYWVNGVWQVLPKVNPNDYVSLSRIFVVE